MKTRTFSQLLIVLATTSLFVASCTKSVQDTPVTSTGATNPATTNAPIGVIVDMGQVSSNARQMTVAISQQDSVLNATNHFTLGTDHNIGINFYVNVDGFIPSGSYTFTTSDQLSPFTFNNAWISMMDGDGNLVTNTVVDGHIIVNHSVDRYRITYSFKLESGEVLDGTYLGSLAYSDNEFNSNIKR